MATQDAAQPGLLRSPPELGIVAAGSGLGQQRGGVEIAPKVIMAGPLSTYIVRSDGPTVHGDVEREQCLPLHTTEDYLMNASERARAVSRITHRISQQVYEHAMSGRMVLTLGGDHSATIGSVYGMSRAIDERFPGQKELGVICVGAHADLNAPGICGAANVQGMPFTFVSGLAAATPPGAFGWIEPEHVIPLGKLVYIGLRDVGSPEAAVIEHWNIRNFTPYAITHQGIKGVMDDVLEYLGPDTPIHLSFDIRGLDPEVAPSTGLPVLNGLTLREGSYLCERLSRSGQLVSMDLVEVNPKIGTEADKIKTLEAAFAMIVAGLSGIY